MVYAVMARTIMVDIVMAHTVMVALTGAGFGGPTLFRPFQCYPPIRSSPRRSPSACPEKGKKKGPPPPPPECQRYQVPALLSANSAEYRHCCVPTHLNANTFFLTANTAECQQCGHRGLKGEALMVLAVIVLALRVLAPQAESKGPNNVGSDIIGHYSAGAAGCKAR